MQFRGKDTLIPLIKSLLIRMALFHEIFASILHFCFGHPLGNTQTWPWGVLKMKFADLMQ